MLIKTTRGGILILSLCVFAVFFLAISWFPQNSFQPPEYAKQWTSDHLSSLPSFPGFGSSDKSDKPANKVWDEDTTSAHNPVADVGAILSPPSASESASSPHKATGSSSDSSSDLTPGSASHGSSSSSSSSSLSSSDKSHDPESPSHKSGSQPSGADSHQTSSPSPAAARVQDPDLKDYHQIFAISTKNGSYFPVKFDELPSMNPNFIPHYSKPNTWVTVAQRFKYTNDNQFWFTELVCDATFKDGVLQCESPPLILPIAATESGKCEGDISHFVYNVGPHDARVFYGPENPYIMYGSNSRHNCFGLWTQDFRMLADWSSTPMDEGFRFPVDLQRPAPYNRVEKNWFFFWDVDNQMYLHHDLVPNRVFTKVSKDGSVGPDLAPATREADAACMKAHTPSIAEGAPESIHQATNSLAVTMCKKSDPACKKTADNTYIMHLFQYKTYYLFHGVYEPYVMLYHQKSPFGLYGISSKPIWITGRKKAGERDGIPKDQTEMAYVTSVNWKAMGNKYHGYLDDVLMLGFGLEDKTSGGIDVTAEDLIGTLSLCNDAK